MSIRIAPSILSADLSKLADEIAMLEEGGADWIHIDVMDGRFVPNLTFGAKVIESVRKLTKLPIDVHLMVVQPENYFESFAGAGASGMSIHTEVSPHLQRQLNRIRELGCRAGAVVNPATPLIAVSEVIADLDLLLVMTVNPGFGGQEFIHECLPKIQQADAWRRERKLAYRIEVDGGINNQTAAECARAGADTFVAGTSLFGQRNLKAAVTKMRKIVNANDPALADLKV